LNQDENGVWAVVDSISMSIETLHRTELDALRHMNSQGYGFVKFIPYEPTISAEA